MVLATAVLDLGIAGNCQTPYKSKTDTHLGPYFILVCLHKGVFPGTGAKRSLWDYMPNGRVQNMVQHPSAAF